MIARTHSGFPRLLIADFDADSRAELRKIVHAAGYPVVAETAESHATLNAASCLRADLTLLHSDLPPYGGVATAAQLIQKRIAPVLLVLDCLQPDLAREAAAVGVHAILTKPLRAASLLPAIEMAAHLWRTARQAEYRLQRLQEKEQTRDLVDCAKQILMASGNLTEERAYRWLQSRSMQTRQPMRAIAEAVLLSYKTVHSDQQAALPHS